VHVGWLLAAAGIYICALTLGTARWQAQLRGVSKSVPFGFTLRAFIKGIACSTIASPRASISARVRALSRGMHLSARSVLVSVVLDSVLTAIGLATTLAVLGSWSDLPPRIWPEVATGLGLLTLAVALPSAVFVSRHVLSAAMSLLRLGIARWPLGLCLSLGLAITVSILELVQVLCCLKAVGVGQPLGLAIVALLAMKLAKLVPFVPAGSLVVAEASAVIVLMGSGVAREQAVAFAIVNCATLLGPLVLFGVAMSPRSDRALASG
jgi:uncharacterized membrane protein YbhN (UPF0104 family)